MLKLSWITEKRIVKSLIPADFNPRKISKAKKKALINSLEKFNLVDIPVINHDGTTISGHKRIEALILVGRGDEEIDVRFPNRQLTEEETKEYMLIANTHAGEFDAELLEAHFTDVEIEFDVPFIDDKPSGNLHLVQNAMDDTNLDKFRSGVRKAIQIEFEPDHYEEAAQLVKFCRENNLYIGKFLIDKLKQEKTTHEKN